MLLLGQRQHCKGEGVGLGTDALCLEVQTSARVYAMAKAQPAKKAAKTVQKKATSVAKTARKTVRCGSTARLQYFLAS